MTITLSLKKHTLKAIHYAAYTLTDRAYVFLSPAEDGKIKISIKPKRKGTDAAAVKDAFRTELADEQLREKITAENRSLREYLISSAFTNQLPVDEPAEEKDSAPALTPEQELELDSLIAEVEKELKTEMESADGNKDPLGITKTWEEKNEDNKK